MISIEESYDHFTSAFSRLDPGKLGLDDNMLGYEIFEELDCESISFMHEWTVDRLIAGGLIPATIREEVLKLRERIITAIESSHAASTPPVDFYRGDPEWQKIRTIAEVLYERIKSFDGIKK